MKKIEENEENYNFLKEFYDKNKIYNIDSLIKVDRPKLVTAMIITEKPELDANEVYQIILNNYDIISQLNEDAFEELKYLINNNEKKTIITLYDFEDIKNSIDCTEIIKLYKENELSPASIGYTFIIETIEKQIKQINEIINKFDDYFGEKQKNKVKQKGAKEGIKSKWDIDKLLRDINEYKEIFEEETKRKKEMKKMCESLENLYASLKSQEEKIKLSNNIIKIPKYIFNNIKIEELKHFIVKYIYNYNVKIYEETEKEYKELIQNSKNNYIDLLESHKIKVDDQILDNIISKNSISNLEEMIKILESNGFENKNSIIQILQESDLQTIKYFDYLIESKIISKNFLINNLNIFNKNSENFINFKNILKYFENNKIKPILFINNNEIYLINLDILKFNIEILKKYGLFNNIKPNSKYTFFAKTNLEESIELIYKLNLNEYLEKDLTILNYLDRFKRLQVLSTIKYSLTSKEELIATLSDDIFFIPDSDIDEYIEDITYDKSL